MVIYLELPVVEQVGSVRFAVTHCFTLRGFMHRRMGIRRSSGVHSRVTWRVANFQTR